MFFQIREIQDVVFCEPLPEWARDGVMAVSPYKDDHGWHVIGRGFTKAEPVTRSHLFLAHGESPFEFAINPKPLLSPGPEGSPDELGVEDPTLWNRAGGKAVLFSRVRHMTPDHPLAQERGTGKPGVCVSLGALNLSTLEVATILEPTEQTWWERPLDMCKEAEVIVTNDPSHVRTFFFEFGDGDRSRVAAQRLFHPFSARLTNVPPRLWLHPRFRHWDSDHVSTGPIVTHGEYHLMFYNGRSSERVWAIGEILFNVHSLGIIYRSDEPIILPTEEIGWDNQRIAFSSGAIMDADTLYLYYHEADRRVRCAVGALK